MATQFAFVPVDDKGRPQSNARSLVRRHCMQGKNRRENSRRSIRKIHQAEKQSKADKVPDDSSVTHAVPPKREVLTPGRSERKQISIDDAKLIYSLQLAPSHLTSRNVMLQNPSKEPKYVMELISSSMYGHISITNLSHHSC